jgi:adenylosuccinate synthase
VFIDEKKYILHLIPGGILRPEVNCVIGNGVVFDPESFFEEVDFLADNGIGIKDRLHISDRAHIIFPYHKLLDRLREEALKMKKIGTTGRGIGPAYVDKYNRTGIRLIDLYNRSNLKDKLDANLAVINKELRDNFKQPAIKLSNVLKEISLFAEKLETYVNDTSAYMYDSWKEGASIILEGAQGCLLDVDFGSYPYVTSSNPTSGGAVSGTGLPPQALEEIIGVIKAYTTRVGSGPFPTEDNNDIGEQLRKAGGEFGATTGRPRRCGWFDAVAARFAARINGFTNLALTKLDVLDEFSEVKICTHYLKDGKVVKYFPASSFSLGECKPVYETIEGWRAPTEHCRDYQSLPQKARNFIDYIEKIVSVPVKYVSVGVDRKQIIVR